MGLEEGFLRPAHAGVDALVIENRVHRTFKEHQDQRIMKAGMRAAERWNGDTECYWFRQKEAILRFIADFVERLGNERDDYQEELIHFKSGAGEDVSREKNFRNLPRAIVCIDTNERYPSIAEAARSRGLSHGNLSMVLGGTRRLAGGCRWAYAENIEQARMTPLRARVMATKSVRCIPTGEMFTSISEAARSKGVSNSHITSVCKGKRRAAGGFGWEYVDEPGPPVGDWPMAVPETDVGQADVPVESLLPIGSAPTLP